MTVKNVLGIKMGSVAWRWTALGYQADNLNSPNETGWRLACGNVKQVINRFYTVQRRR